MTTRQFDPVFSAALRNELEALADGGAPVREPRRRSLAALARPQVWISLVTALVLAVATVGVLRLTEPPAPVAPAGRAGVVDPLAQITDPSYGDYVGPSPRVLLRTSGTGATTTTIDIPAGVTSVRPYLRCSTSSYYRLAVGKGFATSCERTSGDFADIPVAAGSRTLDLRIASGVRWRLVVIATPDDPSSSAATTTTPDAVVDPLTDLTDPTSTLYVADRLTPILHERATGSRTFALRVPSGVEDVTFYLACSAGAEWVLTTDTSESGGCSGRLDGSVGEPAAQLHGTVRVTVSPGTEFVLLAVPTPVEPASPAKGIELPRLPYPSVSGTVVGRDRSTSAAHEVGDLTAAVSTLRIIATCEGSGSLRISTSDGSSTTAGCAAGAPKRTTRTVGRTGGLEGLGALRYGVQPTGSVTWTVTFVAG